ncbi:MAG: FGGY-family carbohydrate kinase [Oscillospiraceae bacterium]|nr:FGGY-family carbohydrate kinase [Oscillospiraceae bacterium]
MKTFLGIELGSTRIKAVLIDAGGTPRASGGFDWENRFENGVWTYHLDDVWHGLRESFANLAADYRATHGGVDPVVSGIGVSAMMHGYLAFDREDNQLAEFRTWRNTITEEAAARLTEAFGFNIPQRWSIAHLYRAVLGGEAHVGEIGFLTTLAGYVHYQLTGEKVLGIGDASGVFPIDSTANGYHNGMVAKFDTIVSEHGVPWRLLDILPKVLVAGEHAGALTEAGAILLDPTGVLQPGIPLCPPEGDAGTGMVATNSVAPCTGNVSAGTSVFAMLVLERALSKLYLEIDMVTTPTGKPVAMVHCNNCTSDLDAWVNLFGAAMTGMGQTPDKSDLYRTLYEAALRGDPDGGGLVSVNYLSGEHTTGFHEGRPLFVRTPDSRFTLENFMRSLLFSAMATLKIGMDILSDGEGVTLSKLLGHGGLFKTPLVGQTLMAGALDIPVAVMESAGEGGAWGIALLAAYADARDEGETLEEFLKSKVFSDSAVNTIQPNPADVAGFAVYLERYKAALSIERTAVESLQLLR